jgi:hypothetical protein
VCGGLNSPFLTATVRNFQSTSPEVTREELFPILNVGRTILDRDACSLDLPLMFAFAFPRLYSIAIKLEPATP